MDYSIDNTHKFQLFVKTSLDSGSTEGYGFIHEGANRSISPYPQNDFFVPIFITQTCKTLEYVDITKDDTIFIMQRQEVNPFFVEFSFFDTIKRNKTNNGSDLTTVMLNFIRSVRPEVAAYSTIDLRTWFDTIGKNEFPWDGPDGKVDLDTIDRISLNNQNIISKAKFFNIDINK